MKLNLAVIALVVLAFSGPAEAGGMTTAQLRILCNAAKGTSQRLTCSGYLVGYVDGAAMVATISGRRPWCAQEADIEATFMRYSKAHPDEDSGPAATTIYFAMQEAYPCK